MSQKHLTDAIESKDHDTKMWKSRISAAKGAYQQGEFRQCETLLFRAIEQAKQLKDRDFAVNACHVGLGAMYIATEKWKDAEKHLDQAMHALSGASEPALRELYAVALRFHSQIYLERGDHASAERELRQAMLILEDLNEDGAVQLAYVMSDLAVMYVVDGNLSDARDLLFSCMELLELTVGSGSAEYMRASMIYSVCRQEGVEDLLTQGEDGIYAMQYQLGQKHPNVVRALRWYLKKLMELGETDKVREAQKRFDLHAEKLGA